MSFPRLPFNTNIWSVDSAAQALDPLLNARKIEAWAYGCPHGVRVIQVKIKGVWVRLRSDGTPYAGQRVPA
jgi:hypothetical protein